MTFDSFIVVWAWLGLFAVYADVMARRKLGMLGIEDDRHFGTTPAALAFTILADILCPPTGALACWIAYRRATRDSAHYRP